MCGKNKTTVSFPEAMHDKFEKKINFFQKKARRLGLPQIDITQVDLVDQTFFGEDGEPFPGVYRRFSTWELKFPADPTGWSFVGTVQKRKGKPNSIQVIGDLDLTEKNYTRLVSEKNTCDHCIQGRALKETLVFVNNETSSTKRVASKCMESAFASNVEAAKVRMWHGIIKWVENDDFWDNNENLYYGKNIVLGLTIGTIAVHGWLSRRDAYHSHSQISTSKIVWAIVTAQGQSVDKIDEIQRIAADNTTIAEIVEILNWVENLNPAATDYALKLKESLSMKGVGINDIGIVCSAVVCYRKDKERQKEQAELVNSTHIGKVGDKFGRKLSTDDRKKGATAHPPIVGKVTFSKTVANAYGITTVVKFLSKNGNVFVWFMSGSENFRIGDWYQIVATLKKHDEYNGIKQNILTRCVVKKT